MHMADALVSPAVAGVMAAASTAAAGFSIRRLSLEDDMRIVPQMGVMGAFVFAAQMINFTIPGTGSSGHLCGGMLLSAILGPFAGFLTMICVLLVQCLLFADGGLLALGCNIWNMAFYGCFIGSFFIWRPIMRQGASKKKIVLASVLGCVFTLQLGAFSVCLETLASGITQLPFVAFAAVMQPIHLAIGLIEGLITASVLCFIYEARPQLLWATKETEKPARLTYKKVLAVVAFAALLVGALFSRFASAFPDGLEWSMEKIAGSSELTVEGGIYSLFAAFQEKCALLPDYSFVSSGGDAGTSFSGIVGSLTVIVLCIGACGFYKALRKKDARP